MNHKHKQTTRKLTSGRIPALGDTVKFWPSAFTLPEPRPPLLRGTVVYVNPKHRTYTLETVVYGVTLRETFKFEEGLLYE